MCVSMRSTVVHVAPYAAGVPRNAITSCWLTSGDAIAIAFREAEESAYALLQRSILQEHSRDVSQSPRKTFNSTSPVAARHPDGARWSQAGEMHLTRAGVPKRRRPDRRRCARHGGRWFSQHD